MVLIVLAIEGRSYQQELRIIFVVAEVAVKPIYLVLDRTTRSISGWKPSRVSTSMISGSTVEGSKGVSVFFVNLSKSAITNQSYR